MSRIPFSFSVVIHFRDVSFQRCFKSPSRTALKLGTELHGFIDEDSAVEFSSLLLTKMASFKLPPEEKRGDQDDRFTPKPEATVELKTRYNFLCRQRK